VCFSNQRFRQSAWYTCAHFARFTNNRLFFGDAVKRRIQITHMSFDDPDNKKEFTGTMRFRSDLYKNPSISLYMELFFCLVD
jgi:hypothetical protein